MKNKKYALKVFKRLYFILVARADRYGIHDVTGMFWNDKAALAYKMFLAVQRAESMGYRD
jgi:hypothetical protein